MKNRFFRTAFVASMALTLGLTACNKDEEDPTLGVSPAGTLSFTAAGESKSLAVTSNTDWSVSASAGWLTVTPASGKGNASVSVTAQAQTATAVRNAELTFSAKGATSVKISVTQAAAEPTTVNLAAIAGVAQPVTDASPVSAITAGEQYTGTVAWTPAVTGAFAAGVAYTATITLTAKAGYTFGGVAENFFTVANAAATNAAGSGVITAVFPATEPPAPEKVNIAAIEGVVQPVTGASPVSEITAGEQYAGTVAWTPAVTGTFSASTPYTATITLTAKDGYTFDGVAENFFTVANAAATNAAGSGVITAVFPATEPEKVSIATIEGVAQPVTGASPVSAITAGEQYTGTVVWSPAVAGAFAASTPYTATITLTAKDGYTFEGVAENFFTVANAAATNAAGSGVITAVFPATAPEDIIISITTQPAAAISVTEGATSASISVTASVTGGKNPNYLWYSNTVNSNAGGTATGSISSSLFWIPDNLTAAGSPYYYFCEVSAAGAEPVRSHVTTVTVTPNTLETEKSWYDNNPGAATFSIGNAAELAYLAQLVNSGTAGFNGKTINLTDNIDLADLSHDWIPIGAHEGFYGTFDGKGKTISNLGITSDGSSLGLFRAIQTTATVKNVKLTGVNIVGNSSIGGIAGTSAGTVENCSVSGSISAGSSVVGGVVGYNSGGTVRNCHSSANVTLTGTSDESYIAGGIAGYNGYGSTIEYCYATGSVHSSNSGSNVGGIVGSNSNSIVRYCVALNSAVSTANITTPSIGRVVGSDYGTMSNNYASSGMSITGAIYTLEEGANRKDGAGITATHWNNASWWSGTAKFNDIEDVWTLANDKLPVLK